MEKRRQSKESNSRGGPAQSSIFLGIFVFFSLFVSIEAFVQPPAFSNSIIPTPRNVGESKELKGKDLTIPLIPSFEQNVVDISGNPRKRGIKRLGQKLFALLEELKDSLMKADTEKSFDDEMEEVDNLMENNMYVRIANTFVNSDMGLIDNQASILSDGSIGIVTALAGTTVEIACLYTICVTEFFSSTTY